MFKYYYKLSLDIKKNLLAAFSIFIVLFIFSIIYLFYIKDTYSSIKNNFKELQFQKKLISIKETNLNDYDDNIKSINELQKNYELLNKKITNDINVSTSFVYLADLMKLANIKENSFKILSKDILKIDNLESNKEVLVYEVLISGVGLYEDAVTFTNSITSSHSYYKIKEINISTENAIKDKFISIEVIVHVYGFKDVLD